MRAMTIAHMRKFWLIVFVTLVGLIVPTSVGAQDQPKPQFEVSSIRERPFVAGTMGVEYRPGGRVVATMASVELLIMSAYGIHPTQLQFAPNLPDAVLRSFYDIEAKAETNAIPPGTPSRETRRKLELMLQALLADRFKLTMHSQKKELPAYVLVADKNGLKLQKAPDRDCATTPSPCRWVVVGPSSGIIGQSVTLEGLADQLTGFQGRAIVNKTGIEGRFDFHLPPFSRGVETPGTLIDGVPADLNVPSLSTVLHEIGLRLEPQKQLFDVYIVDHIEKPSAN